MHIFHISAEYTPIAKVGGLSEAVAGLAESFAQMGHHVSVIIPGYRFIDKKYTKDFKKISLKGFSAYKGSLNGVTLYFIKADLFETEKVYGYKNDITRFTFFCKYALQLLEHLKCKIDILHLHDWHTGLVLPMKEELFSKLLIKKSIFTIHNLSYQGACHPKDLSKLGMRPKKFLTLSGLKNDYPLAKYRVNLMKGGLNYSDAIVAVSPSYAKEILEEKNSCGLYKTLKTNQKKVQGIINGIDNTVWDPQNDPFITSKYSHKMSASQILTHKNKNKKSLQLPKSDKPIIAFIGRLVSQKGLPLIKHTIFYCIEKKLPFILLGSSSDKKIQKEFEALKNKLSSHKNISLNLSYDEKLSHQIYAAADFIIVPSYFEPCGLIQMIALRYGTFPIVHKTGGLADTVEDIDLPGKKNGLVFEHYSKKSILDTLDRAIKYYPIKKHIIQAMKNDFSWKKSSLAYLELYSTLISK